MRRKKNWNKFFIEGKLYFLEQRKMEKKSVNLMEKLLRFFPGLRFMNLSNPYMNVVECIMDSWKIKNAKWEGK